ncbi:SGNH/GDSL hydrolase family protein [Pseudodesulfovibrio sp.]|uniref:SGNH/GDSL hydrolase family protein n=1 Tax=Pseudodesulfovibrio sp. TaxID=2035812 RepID=UPI002632E13D|nr:SGNH/GDSL hydrolase family protein [Pseudodesulfovibrio sp.]MDD3310903.1 SGNH/GDSL hydrolase family protein [Pseudodesulfovibrio sp.]
MLYFLGNCQAEFLARSLADRGHACAYRVQASPFTYPSHPGSVPGSLAGLARTAPLADYLDGRELMNQFAPIGPDDPAPELIVLNLHHENEPLFTHKAEGYTFHMNVRALNDRPEIMAWAREHCNMFLPNPATYLKRFGRWLARVRADFPASPILVLNRLSPHPAFGPDPFSYLRGWDGLHREAPTVLARWSAELNGVHVLDMDRVFGGLWADDPAPRIEALCPFLKIELTRTDGAVTGLHARRDIEHAGPLPDRLADKVEDFLRTGAISYNKEEIARPEWRRPPRLRRPGDDALRAGLASGSNYRAAEAVAAFFLDLGRDHTPLLREAAGAMPVCHNTLHMIRAYGRLRSTPDLAAWCDVHSAVAEAFTANGPLYRETYLERIDEIRRFVTAP